MSTNDHRDNGISAVQASGTGDHASVLQLDGLKKRKRFNHLVATRHRLAVMAGQQRSHGLDEADESFNLQLVVETTIRDEFPDEHDALFSVWLEQDAASEHPRGALTADCGICRSIAMAQGLNLVPPEAA